MSREKKLIDYLPSFVDKRKKEGLSDLAIKTKERHLKFFQEWLFQEGLDSIAPNQFSKKHLDHFRKNVEKKSVTEKTVQLYLKTILDLLEYLESRGISIQFSFKEEETDIQKIVNYYFETKGYSVEEIKKSAKKGKIIYSRHTRPARDLLELAGSVEKARNAIKKVALWANSRKLDYAIETVFKKWPEINKLKPKEKKNKPYFRGDPMVWSQTKKKWFVINQHGDWLEFAGKEDEIEWREED